MRAATVYNMYHPLYEESVSTHSHKHAHKHANIGLYLCYKIYMKTDIDFTVFFEQFEFQSGILSPG